MHGKQIMFIVMENVPCKTKIVLFFHLCKVGWYFTKRYIFLLFIGCYWSLTKAPWLGEFERAGMYFCRV